MINIAVCDDENAMLNSISESVKNEFEKAEMACNVSTFSSGRSLLQIYQSNPYNILFLDICMPEISGFEVAHRARQINQDVFIIFITSNDELVYQSFSYQPFYFVRKNTEYGLTHDVCAVVRNLISHLKQYESMILEVLPGRKSSVLYKNIMYIKSDKHYLEFNTVDGNVIRQRGSMSEIEQKLSAHGFIKVHKRNLINMKYIKYIDNRMLEIVLTNNKKLEMSRNYKNETEEKYIKYTRSLI
jgi:DNA-binding LytR/AlgR family response regulator